MKVNCPHCSQKYELADSQFGKEMRCEVCEGAMSFAAPASGRDGESMKFHCPHCSQKYRLDESMLGTELECQGCHGMMRFELPGKQVESYARPRVTLKAPQQGLARNTAAPAKSGSNKALALGLLAVVLVGVGLFASGVFSKKRSVSESVANIEEKPVTQFIAEPVTPAPDPSEMPVADQATIEKALNEPMVPEPEVAGSKPKETPVDMEVSTLDESSGGVFTKTVKPFLDQNCISCHGPDKEKGSLRVDFLAADLNDPYSLSHYQNIIDELTTGNMPPEEEPRPDAQELVEVLDVFTDLVKAAKERHGSGGGRPVRRLTRTEFINTVWDQMGVRTDIDGLPDDLMVGKFETNAETLFLTDMHIQSYLQKANDIVKRFIASRNMKPGMHEIPVEYSALLKESRLAADISNIPPAGYLMIRTAWWQREPKAGNQFVISPSTDAAEYEVTGTPESPQVIDLEVYQLADDMNFAEWEIKRSNVPSVNLTKGLSKAENAALSKKLGKVTLNGETLVEVQKGMMVHPVVLGGIRNVQVISPQPYEFFEPFLRNGDNLPDSAAHTIIYKFAALMKRGRPVDPDFVDKLHTVFKRGRDMNQPFWEAMVEPLSVAMCSIDAIMHFENRDPSKENRIVAGVDLANRLSYAVWRSAPDAELVRSARSGDLLDEEGRARQIKRMMEDEKFERFTRDFTNQWFELPRQDEIAVDPRIYPDFDPSIAPSMKEETIEFMLHLVHNDLALANLIDSDFAVVNNAMARHYGIPDVVGPEFRAVPNAGGSDNRRRGGILTQAGILMQGGTGERSSIVERGAFVARKIIDKPPGTPPPLVGELATDSPETVNMTGGELVKLHASAPQCAGCHAGIDPLGMGLEEFDAVGLFRTEESRLNPSFDSLSKRLRRNPANLVISVPLDSSGYLYDGQTFVGVSELKRTLLTKKDNLARGFVKALLSFTNGRESNLTDEAIVDSIVEQAAAGDYPVRTIIENVLRSEVMIRY
ncbi:MAG: DUF1592 domain-containing protein [Akkermansiaceae bacterium]|nr:DUF1592 domain-containing protein [Akkermansiaceae bacterium]MDP4719622.1 DUF1592 domain-containing protein [Akkermansiaceae bacterium]MDP4780869.1 DUF1592 domain-containing protein [Akkermansiaceae bacterium]MDP4848443.1 DUF1592 domain-containing protein [Akkermansiaceae bacterium]MDP4896839.1 DUF1592 domain-containing protein [Akkermansiaceae bacterium]